MWIEEIKKELEKQFDKSKYERIKMANGSSIVAKKGPQADLFKSYSKDSHTVIYPRWI
jgi:hypothetical protein